jgi:hypothetical protein
MFFEQGKKNSASFYGSGIFLFIGLVISSASLPFMLSAAEVQHRGSSFLWALLDVLFTKDPQGALSFFGGFNTFYSL